MSKGRVLTCLGCFDMAKNRELRELAVAMVQMGLTRRQIPRRYYRGQRVRSHDADCRVGRRQGRG